MLKFENPALKPFIILFFAFSFSDALSTPILGGIPITPVQIAILYGIFILKRKRNVSIIPTPIINIQWPILIYYSIIILSTLLVWFDFGLNVSFLTIGFNLYWFLTMLPFLSKGINESDILKFLRLLQGIILFVTVPSGLYELITHTHVLSTQYGLAENTFYLRGFHIDKLEFGSMLACGSFISLVNFIIEPGFKKKLFNMIVLFLTTFLITFSFSTTSILGMITGIALILLFKSKRMLLLLPFLIAIGYIGKELILETELYSDLSKAYELKYTLSVEQYEEKNFRYSAILTALEKFQDAPFFGYGVGRSGEIIMEKLIEEKPINSHNLIADELIEYGLIGFIPLIIFLVRLYRLLFIQIKKQLVFFIYYEAFFLLAFALGFFLIFRFMLYYHRFDQTFYFIWAAFVIASYGTFIRRSKSLITDENSNLRTKT